MYVLFQSDRKNTDSDDEVQDPMRIAVKEILADPHIQADLTRVAETVKGRLDEVAVRTLEKLQELNPAIANSLNPQLPEPAALKWVDATEAKGKKAIPVPLNAEAMQVIEEQLGKDPEWVFTFRGRPIEFKTSMKAWRNALKRAGIENFRWHDLRHTWASWHAQGGTPMHVLQKLGGWQTPAMVQRYAHLGMDDLKRYAEQVRMEESPPGYVLATPEKT